MIRLSHCENTLSTFQPGVVAFTVEQPDDSINVLLKRAKDNGVCSCGSHSYLKHMRTTKIIQLNIFMVIGNCKRYQRVIFKHVLPIPFRPEVMHSCFHIYQYILYMQNRSAMTGPSQTGRLRLNESFKFNIIAVNISDQCPRSFGFVTITLSDKRDLVIDLLFSPWKHECPLICNERAKRKRLGRSGTCMA